MSHHRRHRGCGGCGACGVCVPGWGGSPWAGPWGGGLPGMAAVPSAVLPGTVLPVPAPVFANNALAMPNMMPNMMMPTAPVMRGMAQLPYVQQLPTISGADVLVPAGFPPGYASLLATRAQFFGPIGFKPKKVRRHQRRTIVARPETFFSGKGVFIPHRVAKHFDICSIRVGQLYLLGGRDAVPAEIYSNDRCGGASYFPLPDVLPGQHIYLTVKNRSSHSHWFRAAIQGVSLY